MTAKKRFALRRAHQWNWRDFVQRIITQMNIILSKLQAS